MRRLCVIVLALLFASCSHPSSTLDANVPSDAGPQDGAPDTSGWGVLVITIA